jgi:hypothetical protein
MLGPTFSSPSRFLKVDRLARDLMVQEHIIQDMQRRGITLISVAEPDLCSDDPTRKLLRQMFLGQQSTAPSQSRTSRSWLKISQYQGLQLTPSLALNLLHSLFPRRIILLQNER